MASTFTGPIRSGTNKDDPQNNLGLAVLSQSKVIARDATLVQNQTFYLPPNSQIVDVLCDVITAYDSATSATLSVGTASGGTQYASGVNAKTTGRARPTFTNTQLGAMADIGVSNVAVVATVTSVGQPTVGSVRVTVQYVQTQPVAP